MSGLMFLTESDLSEINVPHMPLILSSAKVLFISPYLVDNKADLLKRSFFL